MGKHQHFGTTVVQRTSRRWRVCFVHISQTPEAPSMRVGCNGPPPFSIKEVLHLPAFPELCSCLPGGRNNFLIPWLLRLVVGDENVFLSVGNPRWGTQSMPGLKTPPWVHHVRPRCVLRTTSPEDVFVVNVGNVRERRLWHSTPNTPSPPTLLDRVLQCLPQHGFGGALVVASNTVAPEI